MAYIITCIFSYTVFTLPYLLKYAAGKRFVYCGKKLYNFYIALSPSVQKLLNKIFLKFECLSTILKMLLYRQTAKGESDSGRKNIQLRPPSPELHNQNNFVPFISCLPKNISTITFFSNLMNVKKIFKTEDACCINSICKLMLIFWFNFGFSILVAMWTFLL